MRAIKGISFGLLLLAICAGILLLSDSNHRSRQSSSLPAISIFQFTSRPVLDDSVRGCLDGLAARGYSAKSTMRLRLYNAEADMATANSIARAIIDDGCRIAVTFSTPSLQVMAGANRAGKVIHIFGAVTDPYMAGVGLSRGHSDDRPPHLAGIGTFQPVKEVWRLAKQINPRMEKVGAVWCTSETCSEACTMLARATAGELGIALLEMPISSSTEIPDAVRALLTRNVDAIWIGGDNMVEMAAPVVIELALQSGVPVFANAPHHAVYGALLALGADYYQVGRTVGTLTADVIEGRKPADIPVDNVVPPLLWINTNILARLRAPDNWRPAPDVLRSAARVIGATDEKPPESAPATSVGAPQTYRIGLMYYGPDPFVDHGIAGLKDGLRDLGLVEGANAQFLVRNAQSDISQIPQMVRQMDDAGLDLLTPMTTPCLTAAISAARRTPLVFTLVYDPVAAGAGANFTNHLPNLTGIGSFPPLPETMAFIRRTLPGARRIGTIYNPAEINSSRAVAAGQSILQEMGIELDAIGVASSSELHTAALALAQRGVDAIWVTGDNTAISGFAAIAKMAQEQRLPLICNDIDMIEQGAMAAVGFNPYDSGYAAAEPVARVLRGEAPGNIPIRNVSIRQLAIAPAVAQRIGLNLNARLLSEADILGGSAVKTWNISLIELMETPAQAQSRAGLLAGLKSSGLREGQDYTLRIRNAQGDMSLLGALVDAALTDGTDMFLTITTPALQTLLQKAQSNPRIAGLPIIYTLSLDPLLIGDTGDHTNHLANVAGVFDRSPFEDLLQLLREIMPDARRIGTLYAASESNAIVFRDELTRTAGAGGLETLALPINSAGEASDTADALAQRGIDAICQINDNLTEAAFPAIAAAARRARLPVFAFSSGLADMGAVLSLANDHYDAGAEAGELAARIMRGQSPASIAYRPGQRRQLIVNLDAAAEADLIIPKTILQRANRIISLRPKTANTAGIHQATVAE